MNRTVQGEGVREGWLVGFSHLRSSSPSAVEMSSHSFRSSLLVLQPRPRDLEGCVEFLLEQLPRRECGEVFGDGDAALVEFDGDEAN